MLARGRKEGTLEVGNTGKRASYYACTSFEPIEAEKLAFTAIQEAIYKEDLTILHHFDPDKPLFLQIDRCLERGFDVMVFHLQEGYY